MTPKQTSGRAAPAGPEVDSELRRLHAEGRAAWPELLVDFAAFGAHLLELRGAGESEAPPAGLRGPDLYLACACALGDPRAVAALHGLLRRDLPRVLASAHRADAFADDLLQELSVELLLPRDGRRAIAGYRGRGSLRSWLRVAATRLAQRLRTAEGPSASAVPEAPAGGPTARGADLEYARRRYHRDFESALTVELAALPQRGRSLLRLHYVDGLSLEQLARVYHLSRATVARELAGFRDSLTRSTRERLLSGLRVTPDELDSLARLAASQLHLSIGRLLADK